MEHWFLSLGVDNWNSQWCGWKRARVRNMWKAMQNEFVQTRSTKAMVQTSSSTVHVKSCKIWPQKVVANSVDVETLRKCKKKHWNISSRKVEHPRIAVAESWGNPRSLGLLQSEGCCQSRREVLECLSQIQNCHMTCIANMTKLIKK